MARASSSSSVSALIGARIKRPPGASRAGTHTGDFDALPSVASAVVAASTSCVVLGSIQANVCGNGFVESANGEACEPANVDGGVSSNGCGVSGAAACRYICGAPIAEGGVEPCDGGVCTSWCDGGVCS